MAGFAILDAAVLRPLPYRSPDRLVVIRELRESRPDATGMSYLNFRDLRQRVHAYADMALVAPTSATIGFDGVTRHLNGLAASTSLFDVAGVPPLLGRTLNRTDDAPGSILPVMLAESAWRAWFASRSDVVGQALTYDGKPAVVVGVMPADVVPVDAAEPYAFWTTTAVLGDAVDASSANGSRNFRTYPGAVARLAAGTTSEQAAAELTSAYAALASEHPAQFVGRQISQEPLRSALLGPRRQALSVVALLVVLVLLATAVSAGTLLAGQALGRNRDFRIRLSLGASRSAAWRQLTLEGLMLAAGGLLVAVVAANAGLDALSPLIPASLLHPSVDLGDWRMVAFALTSSGVLGLAIGSAAFRVMGGQTLTVSERAPSPRSHRALGALIGLEVVVTLVLTVVGGLLMGSLVRLERTPAGYTVANVAVAPIDLSSARFDGPLASPEAITTYLGAVRDRVSAEPGVSHVAFAQSVPFSGFENHTTMRVEGRPRSDANDTSVALRFVSDGYFELLGIRLARGRFFAAADTPRVPSVAIVNRTLVRTLFGSTDPLGHRLVLGWGGDTPKTIVGVIDDIKQNALSDRPEPEVYVPQAQFGNRSLSMLVAASSDTGEFGGMLASVLHAVDPAAPLVTARSLASYRARTLAQPRLAAVVGGGLAVVTLAVMLVGLLGTTRTAVEHRRREAATRIALGARPTDVRHLFVGRALRPVLLGILAGLPLAIGVGRLLQGLLFGIGPMDPVTLILSVGLVLGGAWLACASPVRRVIADNPIVALREG
jgi:putative ABC transport system permease protein